MVTSGVIRRNAKVRVLRDGAVVADNLDLSSLRREKDDASEVREGFECGLVLRSFQDIKIGDIVEAFEMREIRAADHERCTGRPSGDTEQAAPARDPAAQRGAARPVSRTRRAEGLRE